MPTVACAQQVDVGAVVTLFQRGNEKIIARQCHAGKGGVMSNEEIVMLQKLLYECIKGEEDGIWEARDLQHDAQSDRAEHQRVAAIMRRWAEMRIEAAEERLAWLRREFDASTMGKVE